MNLETPYIQGWEVTTNENNIKMATIPLDKMHEVVKYLVDSKEKLSVNDKDIEKYRNALESIREPFSDAFITRILNNED